MLSFAKQSIKKALVAMNIEAYRFYLEPVYGRTLPWDGLFLRI